MHLSHSFAFIQHYHQHRSIGAWDEAGVRELRLREHVNRVLFKRAPSITVYKVRHNSSFINHGILMNQTLEFRLFSYLIFIESFEIGC